MDRECSFTDLETFLSEELPLINAARPTLRAVFATYNRVAGHDSGSIWSAGGLGVQVANGGLPPPVGLLFAMAAESLLRRVRGAVAQADVESQIAALGDLGEGDDVLAVVYAGVTAFAQSVEFVAQLRCRVPRATIVLVTCECGTARKRRCLAPLMASGVINCVIETPECGGERTMGAILDALIEARAGNPGLPIGQIIS